MRFVVQHVEGERDVWVEQMAKDLPGLQVVTCDGYGMETFRRALIGEGHWHFEDDVILAPDFLERAEAVLGRVGKGTVVRGFARKYDQGWFPGSKFAWMQCVWIPEGFGPAIAEFSRGWEPLHPEHPTGFDNVVRDWLVKTRTGYWLESPSMVQHVVGNSVCGPRPRDRQSATFKETYEATSGSKRTG